MTRTRVFNTTGDVFQSPTAGVIGRYEFGDADLGDATVAAAIDAGQLVPDEAPDPAPAKRARTRTPDPEV